MEQQLIHTRCGTTTVEGYPAKILEERALSLQEAMQLRPDDEAFGELCESLIESLYDAIQCLETRPKL